MLDPISAFFLLVICACLPTIAYLLPQDPAVARLVGNACQRRRHRRVRRWIAEQERRPS